MNKESRVNFDWGFYPENSVNKKEETFGKIIVLDGIDGSGKKTQTEMLVERLNREGRKAVRIDFPQYENNFFGRLLKEVLGNERYNFLNIDPVIASVLYAADRWESKKTLEKYLEEGYVIILDRYVSSNQIHQGGKFSFDEKGEKERKKFMEWLSEMEHKVFQVPKPDLIIYLSLELDTVRKLMEERAKKESERVDVVDKNTEYQRKSRDSAIKLSKELSNMKVVNCDKGGHLRTREDINNEIYNIINNI
jgi:dTMP kinase